MEGIKNQLGAVVKYSQSFRDQVCRDYLSSNLSHNEIAKKYGLSSKEVSKWWLRIYRKKPDIQEEPLIPMTEEEKQDKLALEKRIQALEKQLSHERLRTLALETLIDVAEEELDLDIRKKPGTKQSDV